MKRSREPEEPERSTPSALGDDDDYSGGEGTELPSAKILELDLSSATDSASRLTMKCSLPPHKEVVSFSTYEDYEIHFDKVHSNRCIECKKNFPSEHLLGVHIEDCHDSFVAVKRERGEHTYSCFVEGCDRRCLTPQKRRMHLIDKHLYPKNFFFAVTKDGIDGRRSLLQEGHHRRASSGHTVSKDQRRKLSLLSKEGVQESVDSAVASGSGSTKETTEGRPTETRDTDMDDLAGAMSALQFVPSSIRFGRGGRRRGFSKS